MKTQNISPAFTGKFVIPNCGANKKTDFMYNNVLKLVKQNQVTTNFGTDKIEIIADKSQDRFIKKGLKKLKLQHTINGKFVDNKSLFGKLAAGFIDNFVNGAQKMFRI